MVEAVLIAVATAAIFCGARLTLVQLALAVLLGVAVGALVHGLGYLPFRLAQHYGEPGFVEVAMFFWESSGNIPLLVGAATTLMVLASMVLMSVAIALARKLWESLVDPLWSAVRKRRWTRLGEPSVTVQPGPIVK